MKHVTNTAAFDGHLTGIASNQKATLLREHATTALIIAAAVASLMGGYGLMQWLMQEPAQVEPPVITYYFDDIFIEDGEARATLAENITITESLEKISQGLDPVGVETTLPSDEFVVFRTHNNQNWQVATGLKYRSGELDSPYSQYCYWSEASGGDRGVRFDLGVIEEGNRKVSWYENEKNAYRKYCKWLKL